MKWKKGGVLFFAGHGILSFIVVFLELDASSYTPVLRLIS